MVEGLKHKQFGLIGKNIEYSFSKSYFDKKFSKKTEYKNFKYENFDIESVSDVKNIFKQKNISGLNVTIPYKEKIIPYLDKITTNAKQIGAVNTLIFKDDEIIGENTDVIGFEIALKLFIKKNAVKALILGTGGASKAVEYVLKKNNIEFIIVSRNPKINEIHYKEISKKIINYYRLIINCTPLGTFPEIKNFPKIPYNFINSKNYLFDLIYNPNQTMFMKKGNEYGAKVSNGHYMLVLQAEASWKLWV